MRYLLYHQGKDLFTETHNGKLIAELLAISDTVDVTGNDTFERIFKDRKDRKDRDANKSNS